jgi:hypothetical protein
VSTEFAYPLELREQRGARGPCKANDPFTHGGRAVSPRRAWLARA